MAESEEELKSLLMRLKEEGNKAGFEEVNMTDSTRSPWFSITEDGILSFRKDLYEKAKGTWAHFVVPDMVDGVIVRELDRNFFLNCSSLAVVTISDCVEVLGEQAFYNCESLHTVHFGANTREIGPRCFINCPALEALSEKSCLLYLYSWYAPYGASISSGISTLPPIPIIAASLIASVSFRLSLPRYFRHCLLSMVVICSPRAMLSDDRP